MTDNKIPAISSGPFTATPTGLVVSGDVPKEIWIEFGRGIQRVGAAMPWIIGDWLNYGENTYGETYTQAIEVTGLEYQTLTAMKWVSSSVEILVRTNNLTWQHHRMVASQESDKQIYWLNEAETNGWSSRDLRQEIKKANYKDPPPMVDGEYSVILADPPWMYDFSLSDTRRIDNQYPEMELADIFELQIPAAKDSVLFMWATSPKLLEAMEVIMQWDFVYKTCMVWEKDRIGMGYYARQKHEMLLIATKGSPALPEPGDRPESVIHAPRREHSRKPDEVYGIIETMYPRGQYLELFARNKRDNWKSWGNEA